MNASKDFMKENGIFPKISFKDRQVHTVKLLRDKKEKITDNNGKEIEGIKYLVEEDGEQKTIFTSSTSLISQLSQRVEGDIVSIEMKSRKGDDGQYKSYFEVSGGNIQRDGDNNQNLEDEVNAEDLPF